MKASIIQKGDSMFLRIPDKVLKKCGFRKTVYIDVEGNSIVVRPSKKKPRQGWEEAFKEMAESGDDKLLIYDGIDQWL